MVAAAQQAQQARQASHTAAGTAVAQHEPAAGHATGRRGPRLQACIPYRAPQPTRRIVRQVRRQHMALFSTLCHLLRAPSPPATQAHSPSRRKHLRPLTLLSGADRRPNGGTPSPRRASKIPSSSFRSSSMASTRPMKSTAQPWRPPAARSRLPTPLVPPLLLTVPAPELLLLPPSSSSVAPVKRQGSCAWTCTAMNSRVLLRGGKGGTG